MTMAPDTHSFSLAKCSSLGRKEPRSKVVGVTTTNMSETTGPAKDNEDFRTASRREDANLIWRAFPSRSQDETALRCSMAISVNPRTIIRWMQMQHDMPSWAVKAVKHYIRAVEEVASRIEGQ